ncbi:hypothetical protein GKZ28_21855 [Clostridium chromiireducens]|uniref:Uncharacterized protein n=1 Tax=Clostridium chromiireducens TaxID=225345 RepID=A0A964RR71_9CLOT|nr:hypothetical protein [Clostridium chromiireducens]MVX66326.1 hypothetical protein [Clostridium chromiireducens]
MPIYFDFKTINELIGDNCWYSSIPYFYEDRSERESLAERLTEVSLNCLKIGDLAPDFSLEGVLDGERTKINLKEQRGR